MFTYTKKGNVPVAIIRDTDDSDFYKYIYLNKKYKSSSNEDEPVRKYNQDLTCSDCGKKFSQPTNVIRHQQYSCKMKDVKNYLKDKNIIIQEKPKNETIKNNGTIGFNSLIVNGNQIIEPVPMINNDDQMISIYISGPNGSGKSKQIAMLLCNFSDLQKKKIYIFCHTPIDEDRAYKEAGLVDKITQIEINDELLQEDMDLNNYDLDNSIVVFDDIDSLPKKLQDKITILQNQILFIGRKKKITIIISGHLANAGDKTKIIMNEISAFIVFPEMSSRHSIKYLLETYSNLDRKDINNKILKMSGSLYVYRKAPNFIITEKKICGIHNI